MKTLIVEDNLMERKALQKLFELTYDERFDVMTAFNGTSALDRLEKYPFDLVLLDIVLPDMSGIDVLEKIQEKHPSVNVIMVTACSDYQHLRQSMRCHAIDYIVKPYSIETFKDAIDGFLKQQEKKEEVYGNQKVVQTIKQYIDKNYAEKIKLDDLASLVARDKSYIERLFKKSCNRNIFSYLLQVRIVKAKQFLSKGMCVSETAERVGFDDPAYFGKCFKNFVGCSPQKYKTGW